MTDFEQKSFALPDETNKAPLAELETVTVHGQTFTRATLQPGWDWYEHIRPIAGGDLCHVEHLQMVLSGRIEAEMSDGSVKEIGPGEVIYIGPGHTARVIGNEPVMVIELSPEMPKVFAT